MRNLWIERIVAALLAAASVGVFAVGPSAAQATDGGRTSSPAVEEASPDGGAESNTSLLGDPNVCPTGSICLWGENTYEGCYRYFSGDDGDYRDNYWTNCSSYSVHNGANSLTNRGASCNVVVFDPAGIAVNTYTGPGIRFNNPSIGGTYQDPNLSNGGGYSWNGGSTTANWQDKISAHDFCR